MAERRRIRRRQVVLAFLMAAWCLASACAETTRYRVLSFFFDGVPKPGETRLTDPLVGPQMPSAETPVTPAQPRVPAAVVAARVRLHPPYREFRCGGCHATDSMLAMKTPQEGLCETCHDGVPGDVRFVHGPVAVKDCLFCHHHHGGLYPKMLLDEPTAVCLRCHDRADLTRGLHHADLEAQSCTACHHPHGGGDPFFLKLDEH